MENITFNINKIKLVGKSLRSIKEFYYGLLKMDIIFETEKKIIFQFNDSFIEFVFYKNAKQNYKNAGLYHYAIVFQEKKDFTDIINHLVNNKYPINGAANHISTEAIYLMDPENNELELYYDTNVATKYPATLPLDFKEIISDEYQYTKLSNARFGHLHFYGCSLNDLYFYEKILGFDNMSNIQRKAYFYSHNGYHHHIGFNVWRGQDISKHFLDDTGLHTWYVTVNDEYYEYVKNNLTLYNYSFIEDEYLTVVDPTGCIMIIKKTRI